MVFASTVHSAFSSASVRVSAMVLPSVFAASVSLSTTKNITFCVAPAVLNVCSIVALSVFEVTLK